MLYHYVSIIYEYVYIIKSFILEMYIYTGKKTQQLQK